MKAKILHFVILVVGLISFQLQPVYAKEGMNPDASGQDILDEEARMPGQVEGTGTYFEINDSEYLNIAIESSEVIHLRLESIPETIVMNIAPANDAASTQLTLMGFEPSTTYYKYEDSYHNGSAIEMDAEGIYVYDQDLSKPHLIFIQSRPSTKFIPTDTTIGVWDSVNRIYTLTSDVGETIQIDEDNLTVDGDGHTVTGYGTGQGIHLNGRTGVTVKNLNISNFSNGVFMSGCVDNVLADNVLTGNGYGVYVRSSEDNEIDGNVATDNLYGIYLYLANNNSIEGNVVGSNSSNGIYLQSYCNENVVADNTAEWNGGIGIDIGYQCGNNELTCNTITGNDSGIRLYRSGGNTITDNTAVSNSTYGIVLLYMCFENILVRNAVSDNGLGLYLGKYSNNNEIYNNNFIENAAQANVTSGTVNKFYLPAPVGGNFWNDWLEPDEDVDGFVDSAYVIANGGRDELPLTSEIALLCNQPPVALAGDDQVAVAGDTVVLDGGNSFDANLDELSYSWGFVSWPEGSVTELLEPTSVVTSFLADVEGEYVVSLVVNDGLADSDPDEVTIEVIAVHDGIVMALEEISEAIEGLDADSLRNKKLSKPLANKVKAVMRIVDEGNYEDALNKLEHDLLGKTDGCAEIGEPDNNDWITDCEDQQQLYDLLVRTIELLERVV